MEEFSDSLMSSNGSVQKISRRTHSEIRYLAGVWIVGVKVM